MDTYTCNSCFEPKPKEAYRHQPPASRPVCRRCEQGGVTRYRAPQRRVYRTKAADWPGEWVHEALCQNHPDPNFFFPAVGKNPEARAAVAFCQACPVKTECLEYALRLKVESGVWGGATNKDRRRILKARREAQNR